MNLPTGGLLSEESLDWLRDNYDEFIFQAERDVVWTVQTYLVKGNPGTQPPSEGLQRLPHD